MSCSRNAHRKPFLLWFLLLSLGLRSLIAPGFMLNTGGDGPLGLGVSFCGGLNGIYAIAAFEEPHAGHDTVHHGGDHANHSPGHDHNAVSSMSGTTCGVWTAGGTYLEVAALYNDHLLQPGRDQFTVHYNSPDLQDPYRSRQQPRAPPLSRII